MIFPVPVTLNRFAALLDVFRFTGIISPYLKNKTNHISAAQKKHEANHRNQPKHPIFSWD
jgi:hypothetical protein